jgi:AbrB family looped-hinge helix DNA binding protein
MAQNVSSKGSIVIPSAIRKHHNIKPGSKVEIVDADGFIRLLPIPGDPVEAGCGMFKTKKSVREILEESREADRKREKRLDSISGKAHARK